MNYVMCPKCGKRLCKGEPGTKVEIECPKCGEVTSIVIEMNGMFIGKKLNEDKSIHKSA